MANKFDRNAFMITIMFIIFCLPILLSVSHIGREGTRQFSIYNTFWDGTSEMRSSLENAGFEFHPIISTLNSLTRIDEMGVLAIIGPTIFFDPSETTALAYYIMRGGSVLIADDFGSANNILSLINSILTQLFSMMNVSVMGIGNIPIMGFRINNSLLMDYQSYHLSPVMPVIRRFQSTEGFPSMAGVTEIVTSYPSAISFLYYNNVTETTKWVPSFKINDEVIAAGIAASTTHSWLEKDVEAAKKGDFYPDEDEWRGVPFSILVPIPLSGAGIGNILLCSDPSIFVNELMQLSYDNDQLALNLFEWLDVNNTRTIYYDESHLSSAQGRQVLSIFDPFSYVRMYLRVIDSFTMFPLLAPLFPLVTLLFLKRYYPKSQGPAPMLMTKTKRQQSKSFFAAKMTWYINYEQYDKALDLLYKKMKRHIDKRFATSMNIGAEVIVPLLEKQFPNQFDIKSMAKTLHTIEDAITTKTRITEEEFTSLVIELKDIEGIILKPKEKLYE